MLNYSTYQLICSAIVGYITMVTIFVGKHFRIFSSETPLLFDLHVVILRNLQYLMVNIHSFLVILGAPWRKDHWRAPHNRRRHHSRAVRWCTPGMETHLEAMTFWICSDSEFLWGLQLRDSRFCFSYSLAMKLRSSGNLQGCVSLYQMIILLVKPWHIPKKHSKKRVPSWLKGHRLESTRTIYGNFHVDGSTQNEIRVPSGWWLTHPSEKYESQLGWLFSIYYGK